MNGWLDSFAQDIHYAARSLSKSPVFTVIAVLTLAIGIGATTAIFSAVNATLLRPLPFPRPDQLISVRTRLTDGRVTSGLISPVEIVALNDERLPVAGAAGFTPSPFEATLIRNDGKPVDVLLSGVTEGFFRVLALPMALGRGFTHEDFLPSGPNAPTPLILSDRLWTEMFGRDPAVVGRTLRLAELRVTTTIAGVAAPAMDLPRGTDFWFPLRMDPHVIGHSFIAILRLSLRRWNQAAAQRSGSSHGRYRTKQSE